MERRISNSRKKKYRERSRIDRRLRHVILRIRNAQFYQLLKLKSERINKQFRIYFRRVEEK